MLSAFLNFDYNFRSAFIYQAQWHDTFHMKGRKMYTIKIQDIRKNKITRQH